MKCLVVYFSWSGITAKVARDLAEALKGDLEEIKCNEYKSLFSVFWYGLFLRKRPLTLKPLKFNPGDYDLVIIGAPTWAGRPPLPVKVYLDRYQNQLPRAAFFSTSADPREQKVLSTLEEWSGKKPVATAHFHRTAVKTANYSELLAGFLQQLRTVPED
ncbi:hypothetical protein HPY86_03840 [candidate division WOR-3 bacterium]|nr:hypothetical protein [candidate division WOR-3 bacterium]